MPNITPQTVSFLSCRILKVVETLESLESEKKRDKKRMV